MKLFIDGEESTNAKFLTRDNGGLFVIIDNEWKTVSSGDFSMSGIEETGHYEINIESKNLNDLECKK